jgi:tetratricopeptide (TPR) repeat protein
VANLGTSVPLDVFSADEALEFLEERTGLDDGRAAAVAAELGYLPLALAQAAAVIDEQHLEYSAYLERLRSLPIVENLIGEDMQPYPQGVTQTVLLSLEAARASDQAGVGAGVIELMTVLSAAGVRRELLYAAGQAGALANGGQRVAAAMVNSALKQLAGWSLLTFSVDGQTVMAHRLVTHVIRDGLARQGRLSAVCLAAASVLEARGRALAGSPDRPATRGIVAHVSALMENAGSARESHGRLATALLRLRFLALYHLIELGDSAPQAIAIGEPLAADLTRTLGPNHPDTLNSRNSLAAAYQAAGRTDQAILMFKHTLVSRERLLGPDHPDTLTSQNNLAAAYQDAGQVAEAILLYELTLAARGRLLGPDHPNTLNSQGNLAAALRDAGRVAEAIPLLERTLAVRERLLGPDYPDSMATRNSLAAALRDAGRVAEAIPLLERTLAVREQVLGSDHPRTLASRNNLAAAYRRAGRSVEAIRLHQKTLAACERLLGPDHPRTLASRNNLAAAYRHAGRSVEAIPLLEQTLATRERLLGSHHPDTLTTRNDLALANREASRAGLGGER